MSEAYEQLNNALLEAGLPEQWIKHGRGFNSTIEGAISILVNTRIDPRPYADILLKYTAKLKVANEIEMVARCMSCSKGFQRAIPWLLSLFEGYPDNGLEGQLWAVANAIYTIDDKNSYPDVIAICRMKKYTTARQPLMGTLARAKTDLAYDVLIESLHDGTLRAHAIEAIGRFGRSDAIAVLESLDVQKGLYEFKAKETALRRLRRKAAKSES